MRLASVLLGTVLILAGGVAVTPANAEAPTATLTAPTAGTALSGTTTLEAGVTGAQHVKFFVKNSFRTASQIVADYAEGEPVDGVVRWTVPT